MSKELKKLRNQRKGFLIHVNKHVATIETVVSAELTVESAKTLRIATDALQEYQEKLENLGSQILDLIEDDDELETESVESADHFEKILSVIKTSQVELTNFDSQTRNGTDNDTSTYKTSFNITSKLPKLEISPFNGDPITWQEFWDTFQTSIDQRNDLNDVDKLKYLKSYLTDDAVGPVEGFRMTAANYPVVVATLKERYANPEIAIHAHFEKLLALPAGQNDSKNLQKVYDECERHIRSLVALGLTEDTFGKVFTPIILSKLPRATRVQICRTNGSKPWELRSLRELMKEEIQAREMSDRYNDSQKKSSDKPANEAQKSKPKHHPPTQSTFARPATKSTPKTNCVFCDKLHYAAECDVYKTVDARKSQLKGRCLRCLSSDHQVNECERTTVCYYCKKDNHHSSLCFGRFGGSSKTKGGGNSNRKPKAADSKSEKASDTASGSSLMSAGHQVQMQMATIRFPNSKTSARVFFDCGSSRSYVTSSLARELSLDNAGTETISSAKFGDKRRKTETYDIVEVPIPTIDHDILSISVLVTDNICCSLTKYPINVKTNPVLQLVPLADDPISHPENVTIDILIGQDYYYDFVGTERLTLANGMTLVQSNLGYLVTGKVPSSDTSPDNTSLAMLRLTENSDEQLQRFWSLEDIGIRDCPYEKDDESALKQFNDTIRLSREGRYEVKWPWKSKNTDLSSNFGLAYGCLKSMAGRVGRDQETMKLYDATIKDQLDKNVIEQVDVEPLAADSENLIHYIPHHPVIRKDNATTKLRIVYNASAKCSKTKRSLNECLLRGPVFLSDLGGMLLRFRLKPIAISCDIEKAFLQVQLQESERDVSRFLWLKDINKPVSKENLVVYRFTRVPFRFISSPFLLQGTVKYHLQEQRESLVARDIAKNIYTDNVITGVENVQAAFAFYDESKKIFSDISMNLRQWFTNSSELRDFIKSPDRGDALKTKVLGLSWDTTADVLSCESLKMKTTDTTCTKRSILQTVSTIFDPCGFFTPVTVRGKMLVQRLWEEKVPWDSSVPQPVAEEFDELCLDLNSIRDIKLPRLMFSTSTSALASYELHCFCDASAKAYSAVVYLRRLDSNKNSVSLVFSKVRLAPMKTVTLPRLELMAVVLGVRLTTYVQRELNLDFSRVVIWSDAKCVLHWIHSNKVLSVFVENRISEIKSHQSFEFRYVPTGINPADVPTRGSTTKDLAESDLWWSGPKYLLLEENMWPENEFKYASSQDIMAEERNETVLAKATVSTSGVGNLIDVDKFSSRMKLLRVTAWMQRFINNCRLAPPLRCVDPISADELKCSETKWILFVQQSSKDVNEKFDQQFKSLRLFYDSDGLLRCRGRLEHSSLRRVSREPIFVPKNHTFTRLIIRKCHESLFHAGVRHTLAQLRITFWVPQGRSQVKFVISRCQLCRRAEGGPFRVPDSPALPAFRVSRTLPFSSIGLDYLGPLLIKVSNDDNATSKVWICLFTCAATRAVHLEVVTDNTADQFMMALRRFSALYGSPNHIVSDNAKQFKSSSDTLLKTFQSTSVQDYSSFRNIQWKFITAMSPWMGGFYERLVGSVKRALRKVLQKKCLTLMQLQTVVAEVASIVNSRPLVPAEQDVGELALTPAHFLAKAGRVGLPGPSIEHDDSDFNQNTRCTDLLKNWSKGQKNFGTILVVLA